MIENPTDPHLVLAIFLKTGLNTFEKYDSFDLIELAMTIYSTGLVNNLNSHLL